MFTELLKTYKADVVVSIAQTFKLRRQKMEEIILGAIGGIVIVAVVTNSKILQGAAKKLIKTGYAVTGAVTAGGACAMQSVKDLMAESKTEFEAAQAAKA